MNYNARKYNAQRYNIDGVYYLSSLTESVSGVDATQLADFLQSLSDSLTASDSMLSSYGLFLVDFTFLDDMIQIQFANKALSDTVRMADWLSIERAPAQNGWFD